MITSREILDEIGLFDARIPFNYDDILMSFRTWLSGKRVVTVSASRVYHIGGAATAKYLNSYTVKFSNLRAKLLLIFDVYYKGLDLFKALFNLSFSIAFDCSDLILKQQIKAFQANIRAPLWILRNFKYVWTNRLDHWKNARVSPDCLLEKMIRLHVQFPLDIIPSINSYEMRRTEILLYEKKVSLHKELKQTLATVITPNTLEQIGR